MDRVELECWATENTRSFSSPPIRVLIIGVVGDRKIALFSALNGESVELGREIGFFSADRSYVSFFREQVATENSRPPIRVLCSVLK